MWIGAIILVPIAFFVIRVIYAVWSEEGNARKRNRPAVTLRISRIDPKKQPATVNHIFWNLPTSHARAKELVDRVASGTSVSLPRQLPSDDALKMLKALRKLGAEVSIGQAKSDEPRGSNGSARKPIPERIRHEVWRRDQGRCVECGSRERLEFDHIIPVSRGGANTARNLELRCETCNRSKGARI